jgi:hypothetical protein
MKKILIIMFQFAVLLTTIVFCQTKTHLDKLENRDGIIYSKETDKPYSGKVFDRNYEGKISFEGKLKNGKSDGKWRSGEDYSCFDDDWGDDDW